MGSKVKVPGPSAEEVALQKEQLSILKQQRAEQQLLAPILYKQAGLQPTLDAQGNVTGFSEIPDPNADLRKSVEGQLLKRSQAALAGDLPIDPALTRELDLQKNITMEDLRKQLGPGFSTSTPGIEALRNLSESQTNLRESARRGDITLAESLGVARSSSNDANLNNFITRLLGINQSPLATTGAANPILALMQQNRSLGLQASAANAGNTTGLFGSLINAAGFAGGIGLSRLLSPKPKG